MSDDLTITCNRCKSNIEHVCAPNLRKAIIDLYKWVPESMNSALVPLREDVPYTLDDDRPFFGSQGWSYALFGKHSARTFHALIDRVISEAGFNPRDLRNKVLHAHDVEETAQKLRQLGTRLRGKVVQGDSLGVSVHSTADTDDEYRDEGFTGEHDIDVHLTVWAGPRTARRKLATVGWDVGHGTYALKQESGRLRNRETGEVMQDFGADRDEAAKAFIGYLATRNG